jgi:thiol-disulfide isomerase/thioredoxin
MRLFLSLLFLFMFITTGTQAQKLQKAPDFTFKTVDGKDIQLSKMKGKVVLINFWATWCGPCRAEIPGFLEIYEKYKGKGLEIVGISLDEEGWRVVTPFVQRFKINYPVVIGDGKVARAYGNIEAIPASFFVDKKGNIVERHIGYLSKENLEKKIKPLL